jgi:hypothetical protein
MHEMGSAPHQYRDWQRCACTFAVHMLVSTKAMSLEQVQALIEWKGDRTKSNLSGGDRCKNLVVAVWPAMWLQLSQDTGITHSRL